MNVTYNKATYTCVDDEKQRYRLTVFCDEFAEDPREWSNQSKIICFCKNYTIGDKHDYKNPKDFLERMVADYVPTQEVIDYGLSDSSDDEIQISLDVEDNNLYIISYKNCFDSWSSYACEKSELHNAILDEISCNSCLQLLEDYVCLVPIYMYEHSGITISTGSFSDPWDSGQIGYGYISKGDAIENLVRILKDANGNKKIKTYLHEDGSKTYGVETEKLTEDTWKERASEVIKDEVKTLDQYLCGDVYGYTVEKEIINFECPYCENIFSFDEIVNDGQVDFNNQILPKCPCCGAGLEDLNEIETAEPDYEEVDSCWGFYGDTLEESGILENAGLYCID